MSFCSLERHRRPDILLRRHGPEDQGQLDHQVREVRRRQVNLVTASSPSSWLI